MGTTNCESRNQDTRHKKKHKPDESSGEWAISDTKLKLKPDFVFLSDAGAEKEFIVFELKGPEAGKTLQPVEYEQLGEYLKIIRAVYVDKSITVKGVLVGHDMGGFEMNDRRIEVKTWSEVLLEARNLHVSYLQALLLASDPGATDVRLKQISDFGGKETMELLSRLAPVGNFPNVITESLNFLSNEVETVAPELPSIPNIK